MEVDQARVDRALGLEDLHALELRRRVGVRLLHGGDRAVAHVDDAVVDDRVVAVHRHDAAAERERRAVHRVDRGAEVLAQSSGAVQISVWPSSGVGRATELLWRGWPCPARGVVAEEVGHAERQVASRDRRVVGLLERGAVVGPVRVPVGIRRHLLAQPLDRAVPGLQERARVAAARVRDTLDRDVRLPCPEVERLLRIRPERDDRLHVVRLDRVVELVAPLLLRRVGEQLVGGHAPARVERVRERVHAEVRLGQPELREEALHPLARVADERPVGDPLGRPRVGRDAQEPRRPVEPPAVEDRPPRRPERLWLAGQGAAQADRGDRLRRAPGRTPRPRQRLAAVRFRVVVLFLAVVRRRLGFAAGASGSTE